MNWKKSGIKKDKQSITSQWEFSEIELIHGVVVKRIKNVIGNNGHLTEIWRKDWGLDSGEVNQVFQNVLQPNKISGWHAHEYTIDRIMVNWGTMKIVLADTRPDSPTNGMINEFQIGVLDPTIIIIPTKVFHAVQNIDHQPSALLNLVDTAYQYTDPDHWRIPLDSDQISYKF